MGKVIAVIGAQFGDEGKGKIVDYLSHEIDVAVRFNGGANAGHSVETDKGVRYKVHIFPASAFTPGVMCGIGNGMVVDPKALIKEFQEIQKVNPDFRMFVDWRAHVITPFHKVKDRYNEEHLGSKKIGTTQSGNGPAYADKMSRTGILIGDLVLPRNELIDLISGSQVFSQAADNKRKSNYIESVVDDLLRAGEILWPAMRDTSVILDKEIKKGRSVLLAGAHGTMLDIDHGTYPFVTSSSCTLSGVGVGAGLNPRRVTEVVGVVKAYLTRVGAGAFPTEIDMEQGNAIREKGKEYGTTTGRPRRIGWIDGPMLRHATRLNGFDYLAVTMLDVLSCVKKIHFGMYYRTPSKQISSSIPQGRGGFESEISGVDYDCFPSWTKDIQGCKRFNDLPTSAQKLIERIEMETNVPVGLISVGPQRSQTIDRRRGRNGLQ